MTPAQHNLLRRYVRGMANALELRDWTVTLSRDYPDAEDTLADIKCTYGRKLLTIRLCKGFEYRSLEDQRQSITHELLHAHLSGLEWTYNNLGNHLAASTFDAVWGSMKDQIEFATDAIADAVSKHLPLPTQAKPKKES